MAIQYVSENRDRSVVMAYRLRNGAAERAWTLHGLDPMRSYRVSIDRQSLPKAFSGQELLARGVLLKLDAKWRAAVVELEAVR